MITEILQLAATDTNSAAYKAGEAIGMVIGIVLMLAIPALFILCLVKLVYTKKKGWLFGLIASGIPILGFFVVVAFGAYTGAKGAFSAKSTTPSIFATKAPDRKVDVPNSDITLVLPGHWVDLDNLNEEADLGAGNLANEEYFIVMAESKIDFDGDLAEYSAITSGGMVDALENAEITEPKEISINGLPAIQREISGTIDRAKICYLHTTIESKGHFYQAMGWTLKSRRDTAFPVITSVIDSVTEK